MDADPGAGRRRRTSPRSWRWLRETRGLEFTNYPDLWQWSVTETDAFWQAIWDYSDIIAVEQPTAVLGQARDARRASGSPAPGSTTRRTSCAGRRRARSRFTTTRRRVPVTPLYWDEFGPAVRTLATQLRALGVKPGDRVASTLPNIPEAVIAMLATTSIGAIWTSVSPDFGWRGVLDRFRQLQPTVLICTGGYTYNGKAYDRSGELRQIIDDLTLPGARDLPAVRRRPRAGGRREVLARAAGRPSRCHGTSSRITTDRSECRCGSCSPAAPPGCRKRSPTATAASCLSS